jgi:hypothetical protein
MDFFDFGIYFAAVIVAAVFVFWIVFLLVRSLRPKKAVKRKMITAGKKSSIKSIAQKSQSKDIEIETEREFDENDIVSTDLSETVRKKESKGKGKGKVQVPVETEPVTAMAMESKLKEVQTKQANTPPGETHSLVSGESSGQAQKPAETTLPEQNQTPVSAVTSEPNKTITPEAAPEPDQTDDSGDVTGQEQTSSEEAKPSEEIQEELKTVTVLDDIGELTGEPASVTEAENSENGGEGDLFDIFDTELEEESKLSDFAAGLADIDLSDLQNLSKDLHAILPARPKSKDIKEEHRE